MSANIIQNMYYLYTALLTVYPIIEFFKGHKKWYIRLLILVGVGVFMALAFLNKGIEDKKADELVKRNDTLNKQVIALINFRKEDSINCESENIKRAKYDNELEETFHIIKDSVTNTPKKINYNTSINKAETVNIGGH